MSLANDVANLQLNYNNSIELLREIIATLEVNIERNLLTFSTPEVKINFQGWVTRWEKAADDLVS